MSAPPELPHSVRRTVARLRRIGLLILVLGLVGAGALRWFTRPAPATVGDADTVPLNTDNTKIVARNQQLLYGKTAYNLMGLLDDLKQPGALTVMLVVFSVTGCFVCFHLARVREENG
jgi:hypothetical protein